MGEEEIEYLGELDIIIDELMDITSALETGGKSRSREVAITRLKQAIVWLHMAKDDESQEP